MTIQQFARDLLKALGNSNPDPRVISWIVNWHHAEFGNGPYPANNPLAVGESTGTPGVSGFWNKLSSKFGVAEYASYAVGIARTAARIAGGGYNSIFHALRTNDVAALGFTGHPSAGVQSDLNFWVHGDRSKQGYTASQLASTTATITGSSPHPSGTGGVSGGLWQPSFMKDLIAWIHNHNIYMYGMWDSPTPGLTPSGRVQPGEGGVDLGAPNGTPVYALADGPITASGYWQSGNSAPGNCGHPDCGHGVITQRVNVPGHGLQDLYYQHIQLASGMNAGKMLKKGQLIGWVGPYNEIEMGFNSLWGGVWGSNHPGSWQRDPRPWLAALLQAGPPGSNPHPSGPGSVVGNKKPSGSHPPNPDTGMVTGVSTDTVGKTKDMPTAQDNLNGLVDILNKLMNTGRSPVTATQCAPWDIPCMLAELMNSEYFQRFWIIGVGAILALIGVFILFVGHGGEA